jgi:hypothetical protein
MKYRYIDFSKVVLKDVQKADYEFKEPFDYLKYHLIDFIQVAFLDA